MPILRRICELVSQKGYIPIVAYEANSPKGSQRDDSLMLLHICAKALIEVTDEAGQLIEIEKCPEYTTEPFLTWVVSDEKYAKSLAHARISTMIKELIRKQKFKYQGYARIDDLEKIVSSFLPRISG